MAGACVCRRHAWEGRLRTSEGLVQPKGVADGKHLLPHHKVVAGAHRYGCVTADGSLRKLQHRYIIVGSAPTTSARPVYWSLRVTFTPDAFWMT